MSRREFRIVPVTSATGLGWQIQSRTATNCFSLWRGSYVSSSDWVAEMREHDPRWTIAPFCRPQPKTYGSVKEAVEAVRETFGTSAQIVEWSP